MLNCFFKYRKYDSVTCMLLETGLPSFETIISNADHVFNSIIGPHVATLL